MPIITVDNKSLYSTYNDNIIDFGASFRRYKRTPLDESDVQTSYDMLEKEMSNSKSPMYKGQIVSILNHTDNLPDTGMTYSPGAPYYIGNESNSNTSYYADRVITNSYFNYVESAYYVNRYQLGTYYTGVGAWSNLTYKDNNSNTHIVTGNAYAEIFNDYVSNSAIGAYSHVEGSYNTATEKATYSHVEGKSNTANASYNYTGGLNNTNNGEAAITNGKDNTNSGNYSIVAGNDNSNTGKNSLVVGENDTTNSGDNSAVGGNHSNNSAENSIVWGYYNTNKSNNSLTIGNNNTVEGDSNSVIGSSNTVIGKNNDTSGNLNTLSSNASNNVITGTSNSSTGDNSFIGGNNSNLNANNSIIVGTNNTDTGDNSAIGGNYSNNSGDNSIVWGDHNTNNASNSLIIGDNNNILDTANNSLVVGSHNSTYTSGSIVGGSYANTNSDTLFAIGNGSENLRINAIEVKDNISDSYSTTYINGNGFTYSWYKDENGNTYGKPSLIVNEEWFNAYGVKIEQLGTELTGVGKWWFNGKLYSNQTGSYGEVFNDYDANIASGTYSHAEGDNNTASGNGGSHAEGAFNIAKGISSHAEGTYTYAERIYSHTEGYRTYANAIGAHTEGFYTISYDGANYSHTEGSYSITKGYASHAEGVYIGVENQNKVTIYSYTTASGRGSHAEGGGTTASGDYSHTEGYKTSTELIETVNGNIITTKGEAAHAEGSNTIAIGHSSHAEGSNTKANNINSHAEGNSSIAFGQNSHAEGTATQAIGNDSHTEGNNTITYSINSHVEGLNTFINQYSDNSHAEGEYTYIGGKYSNSTIASHIEGSHNSVYAKYSHAEGYYNTINENIESAHSEGSFNIANGISSHVEGTYNKAIGPYSHAEGYLTYANELAHGEGLYNIASGKSSHAEGTYNIVNGESSHIEGTYVYIDGQAKYSHGEGYKNQTYSIYTHIEGISNYISTKAQTNHVEGQLNQTYGSTSHTEGAYNINNSNSTYSHIEGTYNISSNTHNHIEGSANSVDASYSHAEGSYNIVKGKNSHIEGAHNTINNNSSYIHSTGLFNSTYNTVNNVEGANNYVNGAYSHTEGIKNVLTKYEYKENSSTKYLDIPTYVHIEGVSNYVYAPYSHVEGAYNIAYGKNSHVEGYYNKVGISAYYSHTEGKYTNISNGDGIHAEGVGTIGNGEASHAEGFYTSALGKHSHTSGTYTISNNENEFSLGIYNRSYTSANDKLYRTKYTHEAIYKNGAYTYTSNKIWPEFNNEGGGGTIFTIGDGTGNVNQELSNNDHIAYRHNIMEIHKDGAMVKHYSSYFMNDIFGPVSYTYVQSLGISAYLNTVLAALLENPKYIRPVVGMSFRATSSVASPGSLNLSNLGSVGNNTIFYTSSKSFSFDVGQEITPYITFRAAYVAPNISDYDPIYHTYLGNRLGYSEGVTQITYKYHVNNTGPSVLSSNSYIPNQNVYHSGETNEHKTYTLNTFNYGLTYPYLKKSKVDDTGIFSGALFNYNSGNNSQTLVYTTSTINVGEVSPYWVYKDSVTLTLPSIKLGTEHTYNMAQLSAYNFKGSTKMYFQQLANKNTYVYNVGLDPTSVFSDTSYISSNPTTMYIESKFRYFYGTGNNIPNIGWTIYNMVSTGSKAAITGYGNSNNTIVKAGWFDSKGVNSSNGTKTFTGTISVSGSPKYFWIAIPTDNIGTNTSSTNITNMPLEEAATNSNIISNLPNNPIICRLVKHSTASSKGRYVYYSTNAGTGVLDTTHTSTAGMVLRKITTLENVGTYGIKYDIYYIGGSASIPTGTVGFSFKRIK